MNIMILKIFMVEVVPDQKKEMHKSNCKIQAHGSLESSDLSKHLTMCYLKPVEFQSRYNKRKV